MTGRYARAAGVLTFCWRLKTVPLYYRGDVFFSALHMFLGLARIYSELLQQLGFGCLVTRLDLPGHCPITIYRAEEEVRKCSMQ